MKNKNMISIFVCMLLIAVSISSVTGTIGKNEKYNMKTDDYDNLIKQAFENGVISNDDWLEQDKLLASDGAEEDIFGKSVSIDGDYAIVGADMDDDNGDWSGSAYVFTRSGTTWTEQAKLLASDGAEEDIFGKSVSIDGDYAIVGADGNDDNGASSGSAYVFTRSGTAWTEQAKLLASDGAAVDHFGISVSIDGDYAIVGARLDDDNGDWSGSAYVFTRSGTAWTEQAKLLASDGAAFDYFGKSVSIDGDYAIVGAYVDDDNGDTSGSAYVFTRSGTTWTEQAKLLASDGAAGDFFGFSVSIDGDYAIVGAFHDDDNGTGSGSAYVFVSSSVNQPPSAPSITGPTSGKAGTSYDYDFTATDPNGDDVRYYIDWGDGNTEWTGFSASGTPVTVSHTWAEKDTYTIAAKAQDEYGLESDWATLEVVMPVNQHSYSFPLLQMLLERFPNAFPILRQFLGL